MSEINIIMLNRFLDLKNLYVATKIMCLAQILKKILRILSFGGHLGRHLEYFNFPNDAKVASFSFNVRTYWRTHLCKNILCGLFFWVAPKIFIWQPDYMFCITVLCVLTKFPVKLLQWVVTLFLGNHGSKHFVVARACPVGTDVQYVFYVFVVKNKFSPSANFWVILLKSESSLCA